MSKQTLQEKLEVIADGLKHQKQEEEKSSDHANPNYNDNKTIMAIMVGGDSQCRQAIFSTADVLSKDGKHKIEVSYFGPPQDEMYEMCRSSYSYLGKALPQRYDYSVKLQSRNPKMEGTFGGGIRPPIMAYLKEKRPKFVVLGLREGMNPELLDNPRDIAFRKCLGTTPIICKKKFVFKAKKGKSGDDEVSITGQRVLTYAFYVDWSEDAFHAFTVMVDHFRSGDTVHLIWVKPSTSTGGDLSTIFQRYLETAKGIEAKLDVHTHISGEPNVGQFLVSFANNKRNEVDFLVVYCDLMGAHTKGQELIGSVADWAVRYCQCPVVIPKLPTF